jgi:integrase
MIKLAIKSGLRVSDLLRVKVGELGKEMTVYEWKSKRKRKIKIGKKLYKELRLLSGGKSEGDFLFSSDRKPGKPIHRSTVHRKIKKALKAGALNFDCSAHSTRKLYAQKIFKETGSVKKVQKAMNHHSITSTATYLDMDIEKLVRKGAKPCKKKSKS